MRLIDADASKSMHDLISRQAAIDTVEFGITYAKAINKSTGEVRELFKEGNKALNEAVERLKDLPSAQPEIIRCKDCKYYNPQQHYCEGIGNWFGYVALLRGHRKLVWLRWRVER